MLLLQEKKDFIFLKSNVLLPNVKELCFPGSGINCRAFLCTWHMLHYEIWFIKYKSIKRHCDKTLTLFLECSADTAQLGLVHTLRHVECFMSLV